MFFFPKFIFQLSCEIWKMECLCFYLSIIKKNILQINVLQFWRTNLVLIFYSANFATNTFVMGLFLSGSKNHLIKYGTVLDIFEIWPLQFHQSLMLESFKIVPVKFMRNITFLSILKNYSQPQPYSATFWKLILIHK